MRIGYKVMPLALSVLMAGGLTACDNPEQKQRDAEKAQLEANQKKIEAQARADRESAEAQRRADDERRQAENALTRAQDDYRTKVQAEIDALDRKLTDLRSTTPTGQAKIDNDLAIRDLETKRDLLKADMNVIATATAQTWATAKDKVDHDLDEYRKAGRAAPAKAKTAPR